MTSKIQRALISVYDKTGLIAFARGLVGAGIELLSTGGTGKALREAGLPVQELSDYTGSPEILDGRVKTLHPRIHGGLLFLRGNPAHEQTAQQQGIQPIDLVVVNLYPFEGTVARPGVSLAEAIENIDIGGPSMLRSAAKNHESVTVLMDPADYNEVLKEIQAAGNTSLELRRRLAGRVFARTAAYDAAIAQYFRRISANAAGVPSGVLDRLTAGFLEERLAEAGTADPRAGAEAAELPDPLQLHAPKVQSLRYGENPHQRAALYGRFNDYFQQLHGKGLSYNNILDLTAAANLIAEFHGEFATLAILKHTNPCGVGQGLTVREAWDKAFGADKQAPFGGIIAINRPLDLAGAEAIAEIFSEVIVAPDFSAQALDLLQKKKNLRLLKMIKFPYGQQRWEVRSVGAESYLLQDPDLKRVAGGELKVVSKRQPTGAELKAMLFGWRVVKHVKSNAIVYAAVDRTLGIGAGQMSRVDASRIAVVKAAEAGLSLRGSVVCSDAFFPFPDGLLAAAEAGATAAIQPGGSLRDAEVIAAADSTDMAMAFTGYRHFRH